MKKMKFVSQEERMQFLWARYVQNSKALLFLYEHQDKLLEVIEILENIHHLL